MRKKQRQDSWVDSQVQASDLPREVLVIETGSTEEGRAGNEFTLGQAGLEEHL